MSSNRVLATIADESEIEGAAQSVSRVTIRTESDSGTDTTPTTRRKRRRHRQAKTDTAGSMEVDSKKDRQVDNNAHAQMEWEGTADSDCDSENSYGYIDADDEQSDFPDYALPRSSRPDTGLPQRRVYSRHGVGLPIQRKIERFLYSTSKELTLNQVYNAYPIERFLRRKKVMLIKRGRGVIVLRKME